MHCAGQGQGPLITKPPNRKGGARQGRDKERKRNERKPKKLGPNNNQDNARGEVFTEQYVEQINSMADIST